MEEKTRLTISIDTEVLAAFRHMAEVSGLSVGRCIGEWCADTVEGAQFVTQKVHEARKKPRLVMREMSGMARGLLDEISQVQSEVRKGSGIAKRPAHLPNTPRPVIRGESPPEPTKTARGKKHG